jgi:glutaredoxin
MFLVLIALAGAFAWQHQSDMRRWWRQAHAHDAGQGRAGDNIIRVYTARGCGPCEEAVALLQKSGRQVVARPVDSDETARAEFEDVGGGLPLIVDGPRQISGFDPDFLTSWYVDRPRNRALLEQAGIYRAGEVHVPVLYGTGWCGYCAAARRYFADNGIAYRDLDIEHDAEAKRQYDAIGLSGVPVMVYEDMIWNGFNAESMDARRQWASR